MTTNRNTTDDRREPRLDNAHEPRRRMVASVTPKRVEEFTPWLVHCERCDKPAALRPDLEAMCGQCKCSHCGAIYVREFPYWSQRLFETVPLWFKADFRQHLFWALNLEHLEYLEAVVTSTLRERPVQSAGRSREKFTTMMPCNLPSWLLAAKNREALRSLISRLKATVSG